MKSNTWQLQEAKNKNTPEQAPRYSGPPNKLSQVIDMAISESPQLITRNGKDAVYIVSTETYRKKIKPSIKKLLLNSPHKEVILDFERDKDTGVELLNPWLT